MSDVLQVHAPYNVNIQSHSRLARGTSKIEQLPAASYMYLEVEEIAGGDLRVQKIAIGGEFGHQTVRNTLALSRHAAATMETDHTNTRSSSCARRDPGVRIRTFTFRVSFRITGSEVT